MAKMSTMRLLSLVHLFVCFTGWRLSLSSASSEWLVPQQQPSYNAPQDSYSSFQQPTAAYSYAAPTDGTGTLVAVTHHQHHHQQKGTPSLEDLEIDLENVSLSLRLTCEMNRRLLQGIRSNDCLVRTRHTADTNTNTNALTHPSNNPLLQRGGGDDDDDDSQHHPVHVHPSQSWQPPIQRHSEDEQEVLTMFHQKSPRRSKASSSRSRRGVAKWGPELLPYLHYLVEDVLKLPQSSSSSSSSSQEDRSLILVLTLVYLDRACSVETPRTTTTTMTTGQAPCPFLQPRTVHRLVLTSLLTAARAVMGQEANTFTSPSFGVVVEESLGIPSSQLEQMETQFQNALGDLGLYVDPLQLQQWMRQWQDKFAKRRQYSVP